MVEHGIRNAAVASSILASSSIFEDFRVIPEVLYFTGIRWNFNILGLSALRRTTPENTGIRWGDGGIAGGVSCYMTRNEVLIIGDGLPGNSLIRTHLRLLWLRESHSHKLVSMNEMPHLLHFISRYLVVNDTISWYVICTIAGRVLFIYDNCKEWDYCDWRCLLCSILSIDSLMTKWGS